MPRPSLPMLALLILPLSNLAAEEFVVFREDVLGTSLELRIRADSAGAAGRAERRALDEIDRLARIVSGYDATSEFRRWADATAGPVRVSDELFAVLDAADRWRDRTGGAFDPRVETLARLWKASAKLGRTPSAEAIDAARAAVGRPAWKLDAAAGTAERLSADPLTFDGIAKGMIVGRAAEAALRDDPEVQGVLVNLGGDLRVAGDMNVRIGVADPRRDSESTRPIAHLEISGGRSVSSSGGYQRFVVIDGKSYSHILDPNTGRPADGVLGVTVIADDPTDADALATALCVLPADAGLRLVESLPDVAALIVPARGNILTSSRWGEFARPMPERKAQEPVKAEGQDLWNDAYELLVKFEIQQPEKAPKRGYRRPYIAVWVEDEQEKPVRTLSLWIQGDGRRWLSDLKRWYKLDKERKEADDLNLVATIARATRPIGQYQVIWDGKDDHDRPVKAGTYTICIEAAREHGTYQIIRKTLKLRDGPIAEELNGNPEIKAASLEYRRKADAQP